MHLKTEKITVYNGEVHIHISSLRKGYQRVSLFSLHTREYVSLKVYKIFDQQVWLTLGPHAQEGYGSWVYVSVCLLWHETQMKEPICLLDRAFSGLPTIRFSCSMYNEAP